MGIDLGVVIVSIINLGILYWFLKKYLFEKLTTFMNNRTESIQSKMNLAASNLEEANGMKSKYEIQLKSADGEGKKIVEEYKIKAQKLSDEMVEEAKKEASLIRERAKIDAERELEKAKDEIKRQIITLSLLAASASIGGQLDSEKHHSLIKEFINKAGV
jgi:F-type H+-transporting ATPase subunit b